jgi:hypothetical protein
VGNTHAEADQVACGGLGFGAAQHEIEFAFQHVEIFVLVRMDMRRTKVPGGSVACQEKQCSVRFFGT